VKETDESEKEAVHSVVQAILMYVQGLLEAKHNEVFRRLRNMVNQLRFIVADDEWLDYVETGSADYDGASDEKSGVIEQIMQLCFEKHLLWGPIRVILLKL